MKTRKNAAVRFGELVADYGAGLHRRRGRIEPVSHIAAAAGIVLHDIADQDHPDQRRTTRVAMRDDPLWLILGAERTGDGRLHWSDNDMPSRHYAAEMLRDDSAKASGLRQTSLIDWLESAGFGNGVTPTDPSAHVIDAQSRCREAWIAVRGPENDARIADIVRLIVLGYQTLEALQANRRCSRQIARRGLLLGLDRLVKYYGC